MRGGAIRKNWRAARLILIYGHFDHHYIKMNNLRNIDKIDLAATVTALSFEPRDVSGVDGRALLVVEDELKQSFALQAEAELDDHITIVNYCTDGAAVLGFR